MATKLTEAQRKTLEILCDDKGKTYVGGFDIMTVFDLERMAFIKATHDPFWPAFVAYRPTPAGRAALSQVKE